MTVIGIGKQDKSHTLLYFIQTASITTSCQMITSCHVCLFMSELVTVFDRLDIKWKMALLFTRLLWNKKFKYYFWENIRLKKIVLLTKYKLEHQMFLVSCNCFFLFVLGSFLLLFLLFVCICFLLVFWWGVLLYCFDVGFWQENL